LGPEGLWELLTRKNVNKEHVTSDDMRKYKKILLLTNDHLEGYDPAGAINVGRGKSFAKLSPRFSQSPKTGVSNRGHAVHAKYNKMAALYYNPEISTAFSTLDKLAATLPKKNKSDVRAWLEYQNAYTMHRPARKRFLHNPYIVSKLMDVWVCDILDMQSLTKYNDT